MKKILSVLITVVLTLTSALTFAETPDLESMSFEDLQALKLSVDAEYDSRPESDPIILQGEYLIGRDIKPGRYYAGMTQLASFDNDTYAYLYDSFESYHNDSIGNRQYIWSKRFFLWHDPESINLEDGMVLVVPSDRGRTLTISAAPFDATAYCDYAPPANGVIIPKGTYTIGIEIPEGKFDAYSGGIYGANYQHYTVNKDENDEEQKQSKTGSNLASSILITKNSDHVTLTFETGDIFEVASSTPIVLVKSEPMIFDFP